jgi:type II secretion system protein D
MSLACTFRLSAQVPPPLNPPTINTTIPPMPVVQPPNVPGNAASTPGTLPAASGNAMVTPGGEPLVNLQVLDVDVKDLLSNYYEKWTGRHLIYSTQLTGPIRILISGTVPQSEAIKIVEMTLLLNGFNIVPTEEPKIWKVTGTGQNPKAVGVPFVDREELLPAGEQTVMFLFKLQHADPTELASTIQSGILVPNQGGASSVTPLPKAQALLVTENTNIIRTLIRIVRAIDVEPAEVISEFISLEHAQAEEIAGYLEKLFEKEKSLQATGMPVGGVQPRTANATGAPLPNGIPAASGNLSIQINGSENGSGPTEDNFVVGKVRITADKRTNRLHVVSRPVNMKLIRALIKEYDSQVPLAAPAVRPLRFRPVEEVIDAVIAAIKDPGEKDTGTTGQAATSRSQGQQPTTRSNNQNTLGNQSSNTGTSSLGSSSSSSSSETLSTAERDTQPVTQQVGKSTIIADKRANSIIIVGQKDITEKAFAVIDKLDVPQAQVMIQCIIGELTLTKNENYGLEYILRNGGLLPVSTSSTSTGTSSTSSTSSTSTTNSSSVGFDSNNQATLGLNSLLNQSSITKALTVGGNGVTGLISVGNSFNVALNALENSDRFRVVQRPSIFTTNNKKAVITSGSEVPVPTSIQSSLSSTSTTSNGLVSNSSVQYMPIELRLEVLPIINSDKDVSLEIVQNISESSGSTTISGNTLPNISRQAVKTNVTVPNRGTLILGGLIKESFDSTKSGVPKLVNIPFFGALFGKHSKALIRNELIIMMRPIVTLAPAENAALREKTLDSFNVPQDLESAIMPPNIRARIKPDKPSKLRSPSPRLRDESSSNPRQQ